jgi:hypothetical protein
MATAVVPAVLWLAASGTSRPVSGAPRPTGERERVDLFAGIAQGLLDVKIFPRDSRESRLVVTNKTDRPLSVALPDCFAAVPVMAQFQDAPVPVRGTKQPQPIAAAPPAGPWGPALNNLANPPGANPRARGNQNDFPLGPRGPFFFNVEPEKVGQLKLRTVCLEFGKAEPGPRIVYELKPLEAVTTRPGVREACRQLANADVDQKVIQAAAWHLNNALTWDQLKAKHYKSDFGVSAPIFTSRELKEGQRLAEAALRREKPATAVASSKSSSR